MENRERGVNQEASCWSTMQVCVVSLGDDATEMMATERFRKGSGSEKTSTKDECLQSY